MGQVFPGRRGYHINNAYGPDGLTHQYDMRILHNPKSSLSSSLFFLSFSTHIHLIILISVRFIFNSCSTFIGQVNASAKKNNQHSHGLSWNLKHQCRIGSRKKSPKTFRNRSRQLPLRGDTLPKNGNFWYFWGRIPTPCGDWGEILHSQADQRVRWPCQPLRESVQRVAPTGRKTWFLACE